MKPNRTEIKNLTGLKIRLFREKRGWTQRQLAEALRQIGVSITRDVIANIETQRCPVTDCQVVFFARILDVSWKSLFPDNDILEKFTPPVAPKEQPDENSGASKAKRTALTSSAKAPSRNWNVCEMSCKSVKIIFRRPS